ncbi:MAG TPA: MFS transporter [Syntrophomonas sp.]|jgi:EmrB/QacA subfamily drug resistance transporter|nr:MFS transporter [Syntrophomonas sp.]HCF70802.1 MFS transporter [Syntrophomonas sp.]
MKLEYKWQVLIIVCIGIFMSTLDGSILNIANPTIARSLNVSLEQIQWIVTAYMLVITASLLFFGNWGDKVGSGKIFTYGFVVFTIGSFFCSTAHGLSFLIAARIIQGFGASMMMATGIGIVSNTFPPYERGKALGLTGSIVGVGNMTGPALGGFLVANWQWNVIFLLNVPVGLAGFFLALKYFKPQPVNKDGQSYDFAGTFLFALFAVLLIPALVGSTGLSSVLLGISILVLAGFIWYEKKIACPLLDFPLFKIPQFVQGNLMGMAAYTSQTFVFFLLPFYMERIMGLSPAYSGLLMTIPPVIMMVLAPVAGFLSDHLGSSRLTTTAFILMAAAYLLLSTTTAAASPSLIAAVLIILGAGMAMFGSPNSSSILGSVPPEKAGYAGGFLSTVRNLSYCMGTAASVGLFTWLLTSQRQTLSYIPAYIKATHIVYWSGTAIVCLGLLISLWNSLSCKKKKP